MAKRKADEQEQVEQESTEDSAQHPSGGTSSDVSDALAAHPDRFDGARVDTDEDVLRDATKAHGFDGQQGEPVNTAEGDQLSTT